MTSSASIACTVAAVLGQGPNNLAPNLKNSIFATNLHPDHTAVSIPNDVSKENSGQTLRCEDFWKGMNCQVCFALNNGSLTRINFSERMLLPDSLADREAFLRWRPNFLAQANIALPVDLGLRPDPFAPEKYASREALGINLQQASLNYIPAFRYQELANVDARTSDGKTIWGRVEDPIFSLKGADAETLQLVIGYPRARIEGIQIIGFDHTEPQTGAAVFYLKVGEHAQPAVVLTEIQSFEQGASAAPARTWRAAVPSLSSVLETVLK